MFKTRDWFVIAPIGAFAFALAFWGFYPCLGDGCKPEPLWKIVERSFNLIRGGGNFSFEKDPWSLVIAQYLVPGIAIVAAAKLFLVNLRRDLRVAFARESRNHTIVCGLGETGRHVVDNLRGVGQRVVVIDLNSDKPYEQACEQAGVPVIKGDATSAKTLELAGLMRARALIATTGDDSTNFEIALCAGRMRDMSQKAGPKFEIRPEIRAGWLLNEVAKHQRATLGSAGVNIQPFNQDENAARLLYRSSGFARRRKAIPGGAAHLVIVGFDRMAQEIIAHGARVAFAVPGAAPRITIVDPNDGSAAPFLAANPGLYNAAAFTRIDASLGGSAPGWDELSAVVDADEVTAVIVILPDDDETLSVGLRLRRHLDEHKRLTTPVCVRLRNKQRIGDFAATLERVGYLRHRFVPFGNVAQMTSASMLFEARLDRVARAVHAINRENAATRPNGNRSLSELPWEQLPEFYKQSNRNFADHMSVKLRAIGMRLRQSKAPRPIVFADAEIDDLAAVEHWRWLVEHRMVGWTYGDQHDEIERKHPALLPWESLSEAVREKNRALVRELPHLLAPANLEIRRERIFSAVTLDASELDDAIRVRGRGDGSEHFAIIVDLENAKSVQAARYAVSLPDATVWILLSESEISALGEDVVASDERRSLWEKSEGWITRREFDDLSSQ